jgi:hypothetical protein
MWAKDEGIRVSAPAIRWSPPTRPSISKHLRQRAAVAALNERKRIRIVSRRIADGEVKTARVRVDGEFYEVRPIDLELLQQGRSPEWLGLEPIPDDEEV